MKKIQFFYVLALFMFICSASDQSLPSINNCPEFTLNYEGLCYRKIPNCQKYIQGTKCLKCQPDFYLSEGKCQKITQPAENNLLSITTKKDNNQKVSAKQIILTQNDASNFIRIKNAVLKKYFNMTFQQNQPVLKSFLKTPFNSYYAFTWTNDNGKRFLFQYAVNQKNQCTQIMTNIYDQNLQNSCFCKISEKIIEKYYSKLFDATLTSIVSISKNLFKLHYYTDKGTHYIAFIQKVPYLEIKSLQGAVWKFEQTEIINYIYSQHPFLATEASYEMKKRENTKTPQFEIKFKSGAKAIVQELSNKRQRIIFYSREQNKTVTSIFKPVGSYQLFRNRQDQILQRIFNNIYSQFTFLKNSQVTRIEYQIVSGTNFLIYFKDDNQNQEYVCKVFYSLAGEINVMEMYKNSVLIETQPLAPLQIDRSYDFLNDPDFQSVSDQIVKQKVFSPPKNILYVNKIKKTNDIFQCFYFQVVYNQNTFVTAIYIAQGPKKGTTKLISRFNQGDSYVSNLLSIRKVSNFLTNYRKWLNPMIFSYIKQIKPKEYLIKGITSSGSYFFKISETNNESFEIIYYELIDEKEQCVTHSLQDLQQFRFKQRHLMKKILQNQKIDPLTQLVSLTEGIVNSKITYRMLFSNPETLQKTQILAFLEANGLEINKIQQQNNGFGLFQNYEIYGSAVQKAVNIFPSDLLQSRVLFGMMSSEMVHLYFYKLNQLKETVYLVSMNSVFENPLIQVFMEQDLSLNSNLINSNGQFVDCQMNQEALGSRCYERIKGCFKQIGNYCLICENEYSLVGNECINECSYFI